MKNTALAVGTHSGRGGCKGRGCGCNSFLPCLRCECLNHPTERCWQKFGKPFASRLASVASSIASSDISASPAANGSVLVSQADYERFL